MIVLRNLIRNKLRSSLTLLGIAIGICVFFSLTAFSGGLKGQIAGLFKKYKVDVLVEEKDASSVMYSAINPADYEALGRMQGVAELSSLLLGSLKIKSNKYFVIAGISAIEPLAFKLNIIDGGSLDLGKREILIGKAAAEKNRYKTGQKLFLGNSGVYTIVGVYVTGSHLFDSGAVTSLENARHILKKYDNVSVGLIRLKDGVDSERFMEKLQSQFPHLSAMKGGEVAGHSNLIHAIDAVSVALSFLAVLICCIIVSNTLVMSISERIKEIGVLMAVGWSRFKIVRTIVAESLLLCALGGAVGTFIGFLILNSFSQSDIPGLNWASPSDSAAALARSFGVSLALGLVSSIYPAFIAYRFKPAQAFRYE